MSCARMWSMAELRRVGESHGANAITCSIGRVACSFTSDTRSQGTIVECVDGRLKTTRQQPDLNLYPEDEQQYMKEATAIIYMLVFAREHHDNPDLQKT